MAKHTDTTMKVLEIKVRYEDSIKRLGEYRRSLDDIKKAEKELKQAFKDGKIGPEEYAQQMSALAQSSKSFQANQRELSKVVQNQIKEEKVQKGSLAQLRAQLSNLTKEYDNMSRSARNGKEGILKMTEINKVTKEIKDAEMATQRFYRNVGNYRDALAGVGQLTTGFKVLGTTIAGLLGGLGLQQLTTRMVQVVRDFEDGIARVRAVTNPLAGDLADLRDKALELGRSTRYTSTEVASGMEVLGRLGLTAKQTIDAITPTLHLAQANAISLADAAQYSASAMRAFGLRTDDLTRINDVFSSACSHSATNMSLLGEAMKTAAPVARTLNVSLEETTALIGGLANVGMTGSDAGTGIKQIITALASAHTTKKGLEILKKYNLEIDSTTIKTKGLIATLQEMKKSGIGSSPEDLKTLGGKYAIPRFATLIQNIDEVINLNKTLQDSLGENDRMFEQSLGNTSQAIYTMQSAWDAFLIDVNDSTSDYLIKPINAVTWTIRELGESISMVGQLIVSILSSIALTPLIKGLASNWSIGVAKMEADTVATIKSSQAKIEKDIARTTAKIDRLRASSSAKTIRINELEAEIFAINEDIKTKTLDANNRARFASTMQEYTQILDANKVYCDQQVLLEQEKNAKILELQNELLFEESSIKAKETEMIKLQDQLQVVSAEEKNAKTLGFMAKFKAGASGVATVFRNVWNTAKGFIWIAMIVEAIQAVFRLYQNAVKVEKALDGVKEKMSIVDKGQSSDSLKRLTRIHSELVNIDKKLASVNKNSKEAEPLLKEKERLTGLVAGYVSKEAIEQGNVTKALADQIKHLKEIAKQRVMGDLFDEQVKELIKIGAAQNINFTNPNPSTAKGVQGMRENFMKLIVERAKNGKYGGTLDILGVLAGSDDKKNSIVAARSAMQVFDTMEGLIQMGLNVNNLYESLTESMTDAGTPLDAEDYKEKEKGDPQNTLQNLIDKWRKKKLELDTDILRNPIEKMRMEIITEFQKLNIDTERILDANGESWAKYISKNIRNAIDKNPEMAKQLKDLIISVRKEAQIKANLELEKIQLEAHKREYALEKAHLEAMNKLIASQLAARSDMELTEFEKVLKEKMLFESDEQVNQRNQSYLEWFNNYKKTKDERIAVEVESLKKERTIKSEQIKANYEEEKSLTDKLHDEKLKSFRQQALEINESLREYYMRDKTSVESIDQSKIIQEATEKNKTLKEFIESNKSIQTSLSQNETLETYLSKNVLLNSSLKNNQNVQTAITNGTSLKDFIDNDKTINDALTKNLTLEEFIKNNKDIKQYVSLSRARAEFVSGVASERSKNIQEAVESNKSVKEFISTDKEIQESIKKNETLEQFMLNNTELSKSLKNNRNVQTAITNGTSLKDFIDKNETIQTAITKNTSLAEFIKNNKEIQSYVDDIKLQPQPLTQEIELKYQVVDNADDLKVAVSERINKYKLQSKNILDEIKEDNARLMQDYQNKAALLPTDEQLQKKALSIVEEKDDDAFADYITKKEEEHRVAMETAAKEKDVIQITREVIKERLDLLHKQEELNKRNAQIAQDDAEIELKKKLIAGELGRVDTNSTAQEIYSREDKYTEERNEIETKKATDETYSTETYDADIQALNDKYGAEAKALENYYIRMRLLGETYRQEDQNSAIKYNKERAAEEKRLWDQLLEITVQGVQNKYREIQNGYLADTALAGEHYVNLEYGSEEYWSRVRTRIGERDAYDLQSRYEQNQKELQIFNETREEDYESHEAYVAKKAEIEKTGEEIHIETNDAINKSDQARLQAASQITGGLSQLVAQMGEEDSAAAKLAKVLALAQIAINTGVAISKMVAAESSKGVLGIATTAAGIAEIMANVATAIATVKSAKFATGAVNIHGPGTATSDSIPAYISNGESVMNAKATKMFEPLLIAMNAIGNGVILPRNNYVQTRQTADLSESFTQAVANIRPVVDVQEITRTQNRVEVIQNLDSI